MNPEHLKLYIAVRDDCPDFMVPTLVAHAVLGAHQAFSLSTQRETVQKPYINWFYNSFKKVVLRTNQKEFNKIIEMRKELYFESGIFLAHENKTCNGEKTCAVVSPRGDYPNVIKFAKLWKPKYDTLSIS